MTPGLRLFIAVVAVDVLTLLFDWWLSASGVQTITATVALYPLLGVPLVLWQMAGATGLALHLFWDR